ncbi:hypothetical protein Tco_1119525 [Tanacetum coccineum]
MNHIFKLNRTGSFYPKTYWELLPKEKLGAITQRDTGSYYPKRYLELLPKEILGAITQRETGMSYGKMEILRCDLKGWGSSAIYRGENPCWPSFELGGVGGGSAAKGDKEVTMPNLVAKVVMEVLGRLIGDVVVMS